MPAGGPRRFNTNKELQEKIAEYFNQFDLPEEKRKIKLYETRPTVTGLALFLGFESRQSFYDYENLPEYSYTIKRARLSIELIYENMLVDKNTASGSIFALKNFGWSDKQTIE